MNTPDCILGAATDPKPTGAKALDVVRENDGRDQLVGYLGWKAILERLETPHRRP